MPEIELSTRQCRGIIDLTTRYFANTSKEDTAQFERFRKWYRTNNTADFKEFWDTENALLRDK